MFISTELVTIDKDRNLKDALRLMKKKEISRLLVTEEGEIIGIITSRDIGNRLGTGRERILKSGQIHVSGAMSSDLITTPFGTNIREMAKIMIKNNIFALPLTFKGDIIAIVTKTDIIKNLASLDTPVKEFQNKNPTIIALGGNLARARKMMEESETHKLLVVNVGNLVGIISEMDIAIGEDRFREALDKYKHADPKDIPVEMLMTRDPICVTPETPIGKAVYLMLKNDISALAVKEENLAILTKRDLVRGISRDLIKGKKWR